jgi:hypothetical protein
MRVLRLVSLIGLCLPLLLDARAVSGQQAAPAPPYPKTGVDYTGIDAFYRIADILAKDSEPTEREWTVMLATPGYRLVEIDNHGVRRRIDLALKPSRHAERDSVLNADGQLARTVRHLVEAVANRQRVLATRQALERSIADSISRAMARTERFLPPGTVERMGTPFIAFAVFADDGYAEEPGVLLDPLDVASHGLVDLIAHEFHHCLAGAMDRTFSQEQLMAMRPPPADIGLFLVFMHLRNEGIADQVDKTYPLPTQTGLEWYAKGYNEAYPRTPMLLHSLDSILTIAADHPERARTLVAPAQKLFWSNGHPNGAYMAREIVTTFGVDSLFPGLYDPIAFVRTYASAERKRGNPPPFSERTVRLLDSMVARFEKPTDR